MDMYRDGRRHTIRLNISKRTYTIRQYDNGKLTAKFRSYPQDRSSFSVYWTESDIRQFLRNGDYYEVFRR